MKTELKGWLADNTVTTDNKEDKILVLESAGNLTLTDVLDEMEKEDTGLRAETLKHAVDLFQRTVSELVLNGYSVNTGLFRAVPQFRGVIDGGIWNPEKNSIYVSFNQDKDLREAIARTGVKILGAKGDSAYFIGGEDAATRATDGSATAGRNYRLQGKNIKVAGTDPAIGIILIDEKGTKTKLPMDMIAVNNPSEVLILLPADLTDGIYEAIYQWQPATEDTTCHQPNHRNRQYNRGRRRYCGRSDSINHTASLPLCRTALISCAALHKVSVHPCTMRQCNQALKSLINLYRKFSP